MASEVGLNFFFFKAITTTTKNADSIKCTYIGVLAWAAIMKYHRLGGLSSNKFLTFLESEKPKTRGWQIQCLVRTPLLTCRWLPSCCLFTWRKEDGLVSLPFLIRALIPSWRPPPSCPHLNLITLPKPHFLMASLWGLGL